MADKAVPLTREGKSRLEVELEELRKQRRVIAERIHYAQEQGTSQNDAEYDDAKQEQGMVEGRILEIEDILRRSTIIDESVAHRAGRVMLGSDVEVEQDGKRRTYQIVGAPEADPANGKISNESPVGAALLGKAVGETIDVHVPRGVMKLKVLKID
jgi:transcription elongation factor GreA